MKQSKLWLTGIIVVVVIIGGGYLLWQRSTTKHAASSQVTAEVTSSSTKHHRPKKEHSAKTENSNSSIENTNNDNEQGTNAGSTSMDSTTSTSQVAAAHTQSAVTKPANGYTSKSTQTPVANAVSHRASTNRPAPNKSQAANNTIVDGMNFSYRVAQQAGVINGNTSVGDFYKNAKEGDNYVSYNGKTVYYTTTNHRNVYQITGVK